MKPRRLEISAWFALSLGLALFGTTLGARAGLWPSFSATTVPASDSAATLERIHTAASLRTSGADERFDTAIQALTTRVTAEGPPSLAEPLAAIRTTRRLEVASGRTVDTSATIDARLTQMRQVLRRPIEARPTAPEFDPIECGAFGLVAVGFALTLAHAALRRRERARLGRLVETAYPESGRLDDDVRLFLLRRGALAVSAPRREREPRPEPESTHVRASSPAHAQGLDAPIGAKSHLNDLLSDIEPLSNSAHENL